MLKENELRIGNWYLSFGVDLKQVEKLTKGKVLIDFYPIPLTEDWLLKFGFTFTDEKDGLAKNYVIIYLPDNENKSFTFIYEFDFMPRITEVKFVHQLQNLYFALAGEELKIVNEVL